MKLVEAILESYYTLLEESDVNTRHFIVDINDALKNAPLGQLEKRIIIELYLKQPEPPVRDKLDKNGNTNGRPPGGTTQTSIAANLFPELDQNSANKLVTKTKKSALQKLANYLGEEYIIEGD